MEHKTIRQSKEIVNGARDIMNMCPRITKDSEAFTYAYHETAKDILENNKISWRDVEKFDFGDKKADIGDYLETKVISYDSNDIKIVERDLKNYFGLKVVQFPYMTRLVLLYTRYKLRNEQNNVVIQDISTNDNKEKGNIQIIQKISSLLMKNDEISKNKINRICKILNDDK